MSSLTSARVDLRVRVQMLSDWHIGMGAGRQHSIDRLITRDQNGLPYIPASTMRGIWRDAAERLAFGLDDGNNGAWTELVAQLFGSQVHPGQPDDVAAIKAPLASALYCGSLHLAPELISELGGPNNADLRDATTFIKPGVAIDPHSGMAKGDHLRFEEVAIGGHVVFGTASLDAARLGSFVKDDAVAVLVASAALIERLGAKRRRGLGRCSVAVEANGVTLTTAFDRFKGEPARSGTSTTPAIPIVSYQTSATSAGKKWRSQEFRVTLLSPLIVPDEILGNVVTTQHAIPGSYLLPLVAKAAEAAGAENVFGLIARGELRVLPGYPQIAGRRGLPAALCWEAPKIKDSGAKPRSILAEPPKQAQQYKAIRRGFVAIDGNDVDLLDVPLIELTTHNVIEDEMQRPTEKVGGVYSYEAIASGQHYCFEVWLWGDEETSKKIAEKLAGRHWLGRGKQAGYGQINIKIAGTAQTVLETSSAPLNPRFLDVWLTSDLILHNELLEAVTEPEEIAAHLSEKLDCQLVVAAHAVRSRRIESWQSRWGLPRPTLVAVQAGSVVRFKLPKNVDTELLPSRLKSLELKGIGERRGEGFGDIRFNEPRLAVLPNDFRPLVSVRETQLADVARQSRTEKSSDFLNAIRKRASEREKEGLADAGAANLSKELGLSVESKYSNESKDSNDNPTSSQLGIVRSLLAKDRPLEEVRAWLIHEKSKDDKGGKTTPEWRAKLGEYIQTKSSSPDLAIANLLAAIAYQQRENKKPKRLHGAQT